MTALTSVCSVSGSRASQCLYIIDSAGNRPEFDNWIAQYVDLVLIPVMPDPEDVKEAIIQMDLLESQDAQNVLLLHQ